MSKMRAKLRVNSVEQFEHAEVLKLTAVAANNYPEDGSDEDNTYAKFTPSAEMNIHITNPELAGKFKPGQTYYVDFTEATA